MRLKKVLSVLWQRIVNRSAMRASDSGLFDPFTPIGKLKKVEVEYQASYPLTESKDTFETEIKTKRHFYPLKILLGVIILIVSFRLMTLQITQGQENYSLAEGNRLETRLIPAARGLIYDRHGRPLVSNEPRFSVLFYGADLPETAAEIDQLVGQLASALNIEEAELRRRLSPDKPQNTSLLAEGLSREQALSAEIKTLSIKGVEIVKAPSRRYSDVLGLGHILGYVGKVSPEDLAVRPDLLPSDVIGKSALEKTYDEYLQGIPGRETLEVDSKGRAIRVVGSQPPIPGNSLILGLDADLQTAAASSLRESIKQTQAISGAAVALDIRTGEVLAMVSEPGFDNNLFSADGDRSQRQQVLVDSNAPLINRAIAGQYPSGSTIKPVVALAALENAVVKPETRLDTSEGKITIGQWTFPDWKIHGSADVVQAIAESNNIFFYALGGGYKHITGLGAEKLASFLKRFGFGQTTGIDIPGEAQGLVPTPEWKKRVKGEAWYIGDTYNLSIGQGDLLITPLQLTRATSVIANGGNLLTPRFLNRVISHTGAIIEGVGQYPTVGDVASSSHLAVVREGMRRAVTTGSARSFASLPVEIAAKTGTAQFDKAKEKTHSWFTAFAPYSSPEIAVTVIVEGGGEGFAVAAPVAKNILEQYFKLPLTPIAINPED